MIERILANGSTQLVTDVVFYYCIQNPGAGLYATGHSCIFDCAPPPNQNLTLVNILLKNLSGFLQSNFIHAKPSTLKEEW
jgi:hypothetical protein